MAPYLDLGLVDLLGHLDLGLHVLLGVDVEQLLVLRGRGVSPRHERSYCGCVIGGSLPLRPSQ